MVKIESLAKSYHAPTERHYVFKNLNIISPKGYNIALIGQNGTGRSTLLRIIGSMDRPDGGNVITEHRISWPVGLAGGFQGSLTGRENVKLVARLYVRRDELNKRVGFVKKFSELGKYFDMPIKTYSSGMRSKLAFGLSIALRSDYYLINEITAVGDARFKKKCSDIFDKIRERSHLIMVSYSERALKEYCDVAVYLGKEGQGKFYKNVTKAITDYRKDLQWLHSNITPWEYLAETYHE